MNKPRKHHFIPQFYLRRWASDGQIWRFIRPNGETSKVHGKRVYPAATGWQRDLYTYPSPEDENLAATIESQFLQVIDTRGAEAFECLNSGRPFSVERKVGLIQFLLAMMHRTPGRIQWLTAKLHEELENDGCFDFPDDMVHHYALELFTDLVSSEEMLNEIGKFSLFKIDLSKARDSLLLSDRPLMISNGIKQSASFIMFPSSPRTLTILAKESAIVDAFASQDRQALANAVNDALVVQAEELVVGNRLSERRFIEKRLQRSCAALAGHMNPVDGIVRWQAP